MNTFGIMNRPIGNWHDVNGADQEAIRRRDGILRSLQDRRQKIADACARCAHGLSEVHDLQLISAVNDAVISVITTAPELFKNSCSKLWANGEANSLGPSALVQMAGLSQVRKY